MHLCIIHHVLATTKKQNKPGCCLTSASDTQLHLCIVRSSRAGDDLKLQERREATGVPVQPVIQYTIPPLHRLSRASNVKLSKTLTTRENQLLSQLTITHTPLHLCIVLSSCASKERKPAVVSVQPVVQHSTPTPFIMCWRRSGTPGAERSGWCPSSACDTPLHLSTVRSSRAGDDLSKTLRTRENPAAVSAQHESGHHSTAASFTTWWQR